MNKTIFDVVKVNDIMNKFGDSLELYLISTNKCIFKVLDKGPDKQIFFELMFLYGGKLKFEILSPIDRKHVNSEKPNNIFKRGEGAAFKRYKLEEFILEAKDDKIITTLLYNLDLFCADS